MEVTTGKTTASRSIGLREAPHKGLLFTEGETMSCVPFLFLTSGRYSNACGLDYDDAGRVVSETLTTNGSTFVTGMEYDEANRLTKQTYPDGGSVADRRYTDRNQLEEIDWNTSLVHTRTYDVELEDQSMSCVPFVCFVFRNHQNRIRNDNLRFL